jgi:hypothetical protein
VLAAGGLTGVGAAAPTAAGARQAPGVVGVPAGGANALEVFGTILQDGDALTGFGYVTHISGLRDALLFAGPATEAGARFTFAATARVTARQLQTSLVAVTAVGDLRIYFANAGGADFAQPGSFADGTRIASFTARYRNVLTVIAPSQAVTTMSGDLIQRQARGFALDGALQRLGRRGLELRLTAEGPSFRTDPTVPRASFNVAGALVVA